MTQINAFGDTTRDASPGSKLVPDDGSNMRKCGYRGGIANGCLVLTLVIAPFAAVAADWHEELSLQIGEDESCQVAFMSQVVERTVEGRRVIMVKVHCEDKRSFDAIRRGDDEAFKFTACEVPNAETC